MSDINLIPVEEKAQERAEHFQKQLQLVSIGVLAVGAIVTLFTLIMFTKSVSEKNDLITKVEENSVKINQYKPQEELLVVAKGKAGAADKLLAQRTDYTTFFNKMANIVPQGVYFTDFRVSGTKVNISGKAKTSADVARLVSSLTSAAGSGLVKNIAIETLSSDEFGTYAFVISGELSGAEL